MFLYHCLQPDAVFFVQRIGDEYRTPRNNKEQKDQPRLKNLGFSFVGTRGPNMPPNCNIRRFSYTADRSSCVVSDSDQERVDFFHNHKPIITTSPLIR